MNQVTVQEYAEAVVACIHLARQCHSASRVAAQALLSAYNGFDFQLDVSSLGNLDRKNYEIVLTVIRGRYDTNREPHELVKNGNEIFRDLRKQWSNLDIEERAKAQCPECDGRGKVYLNPRDDNDMRTKPCPRCEGKGRICRCGL